MLAKQERYLKEFIDRYDSATQKKSYLTQTECEEFFENLLGLRVNSNKRSASVFNRLILEINQGDFSMIPKSMLIEFFLIEDGY